MTSDMPTFRAATAEDVNFLVDMLVEAFGWHPDRPWSRERVLAEPAFAHYVAGWPRPGDLGVVAESTGRPVGATWLRLFTDDDPGYGFVGPDVPELTIGVVPAWRGRGVGRALLRGLAVRARAEELARISLSVERANRAWALYRSEGYRVVASGRDSDTMVKDLTVGSG